MAKLQDGSVKKIKYQQFLQRNNCNQTNLNFTIVLSLKITTNFYYEELQQVDNNVQCGFHFPNYFTNPFTGYPR